MVPEFYLDILEQRKKCEVPTALAHHYIMFQQIELKKHRSIFSKNKLFGIRSVR